MLNIATINRERVRGYGKKRELTVSGDGDVTTVTRREMRSQR